MKWIFLVAMIAAPLGAQAQTVTVWNKLEPIADATASDLVLQVGVDQKFGFTRAWSATGTGPNRLEPLTAAIVVFSKDAVFGQISISDGRGTIGFEETTASQRVRSLGFWKDKPVEPTANGSFLFRNAVLRWISFPYRAANGAAFECAGYVSAARGSSFDLSGYWCTAGSKAMTEAEVVGFVNAIGYRDLLSATPLERPPGK
jgi:hypothetical protein